MEKLLSFMHTPQGESTSSVGLKIWQTSLLWKKNDDDINNDEWMNEWTYTFSIKSTPAAANVSVLCLILIWSGEHIDYCGYSVLPMAIEQNILAAVSPNNSETISLANTNPQYKYEAGYVFFLVLQLIN